RTSGSCWRGIAGSLWDYRWLCRRLCACISHFDPVATILFGPVERLIRHSYGLERSDQSVGSGRVEADAYGDAERTAIAVRLQAHLLHTAAQRLCQPERAAC